MIRHLTHTEIDKAWWDAALLRCENRLWYAQSWILDIASPGWEALVDEETGSIMPLTWRRKWGVNYLFQPYGLQQLGLFAPAGSMDRTDEFLAAIPSRFRYRDICLNESMRSLVKDGVSVTERTDQVLSVNASIEELREAYSKGHRRNIRSSDHGEIGERATAAEFFELFARTTGSRYGAKHPSDPVALQRAVEEGIQRDQCRIVSINDGSPFSERCVSPRGKVVPSCSNRPIHLPGLSQGHIPDRLIVGSHRMPDRIRCWTSQDR
ncbi:MAG: hypothetical protein IPP83_15955 [Flavobacteriales bacterium]|nr:hypothetical protein [Flavobacteriales bacterium]